MKQWTPYIILLIILAGCVKKTDFTIPNQTSQLIVVDARLTDEQKSQTVRITRPMSDLNGTPQPATGASVFISNADSLWILKEDSIHPGYYRTDSLFVALLNGSYTLEIHSEGLSYFAKDVMVPGKVFNELIYKKNESDDWYHIDWVASAFTADNPAMWEVSIDWSSVPGFETQDPESCRARLLFFTLSTIDVSQIFAPAMEQTTFPAGSIIEEKRYSLSQGHAGFLRDLLLETNWQGSMFPSANANVSTNLSEGAIGYFGVCAVTELSLVVE